MIQNTVKATDNVSIDGGHRFDFASAGHRGVPREHAIAARAVPRHSPLTHGCGCSPDLDAWSSGTDCRGSAAVVRNFSKPTRSIKTGTGMGI
jgi:hypothetical protein